MKLIIELDTDASDYTEARLNTDLAILRAIGSIGDKPVLRVDPDHIAALTTMWQSAKVDGGSVRVEGAAVGDVSPFTAELNSEASGQGKQSAEFLESMQDQAKASETPVEEKTPETPTRTPRKRREAPATTEQLPAADVAAAQTAALAEALGAGKPVSASETLPALPPLTPAPVTTLASLPPLGGPSAVQTAAPQPETIPLPPVTSTAPPPALPGMGKSLPIIPKDGTMTKPDFEALLSIAARKNFMKLLPILSEQGFKNPQEVTDGKRNEIAGKVVFEFGLVMGEDFAGG